MNKPIPLVAGMLLAALSCFAQVKKTTASKAEANSLLWKITRQDLKQPSFLLGTIHLICPEDFLWTAAMEESFHQCREVCFELDMDDPATLMAVAAGMTSPDGKTLKEYFTAEQYLKIESFIRDSMGMSVGMFQNMRPASLQGLFASKALPCAEPLSYEAKLTEQAADAHMEVTGLETAAEQLALFYNMPEDTVVATLLKMATDFSEEQAKFDTLVMAYKNQDLSGIQKIIRASETSKGELEEFLDERNKKWIERMEERMEQRPVFFAVGAGHLPGMYGIITLLRKKGYTVQAVR